MAGRTVITGGHVVDPESGQDGIGDIHVLDGRIVAADASAAVETVIDACDMVVMAGAIDIHTHVVGANINAAKRLLPERYGNVEAPPTEWTGAPFDLFSTGALYAQMGYTLVVEPAVAPTDAVATHAELELIPYVDRAALCVVGNDDTTLRLLRERASPQTLQDYVAWLLTQTKCIGAKTINPGGVAALKANVRSFDLDDEVPEYGVSSRRITAALRQALATLGVPHPLHLHTHNLGLPGSVDTALATIQSAEAQPMHLAHLQFYGYGKDGSFGMSSGAGQLAEMLAANPQVTADVGQVVFGPTVTVSSDVLTQFHGRSWATPKKWMVRDGDGNGGGVVPYHYKAKNRIAALQWAIGLELFLLIDNPAQIFLTTDHPNGGPFTAYPDIIASLMSVDHRQAQIDRLPKEALETSTLSGIKREYSLSEIATMTRAAPARLLGLADRGHLKVGAVADIAIYPRDANPAKMFANATHVLKNGDAIVKDGKLQPARYGATLAVAPEYDPAIVRHIADDYDSRFSAPPETFTVPDRLLRSTTPFQAVACRPA